LDIKKNLNSKIIFNLFFKNMLLNLIKMNQLNLLKKSLNKKKFINNYMNFFLFKPSIIYKKKSLLINIK
jgi:hypothetical protein